MPSPFSASCRPLLNPSLLSSNSFLLMEGSSSSARRVFSDSERDPASLPFKPLSSVLLSSIVLFNASIERDKSTIDWLPATPAAFDFTKPSLTSS